MANFIVLTGHICPVINGDTQKTSRNECWGRKDSREEIVVHEAPPLNYNRCGDLKMIHPKPVVNDSPSRTTSPRILHQYFIG